MVAIFKHVFKGSPSTDESRIHQEQKPPRGSRPPLSASRSGLAIAVFIGLSTSITAPNRAHSPSLGFQLELRSERLAPKAESCLIPQDYEKGRHVRPNKACDQLEMALIS